MFHNIQPISPHELKRALFEKRVLLIDVRTPEEFNIAHIDTAINLPLEGISYDQIQFSNDEILVFYCRIGGRSQRAIEKVLCENPGFQAYNLEGGIEKWKEDGYSVIKRKKNKRIPMNHQVYILSGVIVILSFLLGFFMSSFGFIMGLVVGLDLIVSGFTGKSLMEKILLKLPYNNS